jgi:HNH endonuclease
MEQNKEWWNTAIRGVQDLFCVYCKNTTTPSENLEHIIPESLGNKQTLYRGAVCNKCNQKFGEKVDSDILKEPLIALGQVATKSEGKKGVRDQIGKFVKRTGENEVALSGGNSGKSNEYYVSRALAKCAVNILTHFFGSNIISKNQAELISYVNAPKSRNDIWTFAALYTFNTKISIAFWLRKLELEGQEILVVMFSCSSGLFAIPHNRDINGLSKELMKMINKEVEEKETEKGFKIENKAEYFTD